jgi:glutathione S-transferase
MITLYGFGPYFELPDPSPFVLKTMVQLQMAGLDYTLDTTGFPRAPKGKQPFIEDKAHGGRVISDSTFIRRHIETTYNIDLDGGLDGRQRALAWSVERMMEDHLYWAIVHARWIIDENFAKGPAQFFARIPEPAREEAMADARARVTANLSGHGFGRHTQREKDELTEGTLRALSNLLGDQPYLTGAKPCGADATVFGMLAAAMTPYFDTSVRRLAEAHPNLVRYRDRMMIRYFPQFAVSALAPDLQLV